MVFVINLNSTQRAKRFRNSLTGVDHRAEDRNRGNRRGGGGGDAAEMKGRGNKMRRRTAAPVFFFVFCRRRKEKKSERNKNLEVWAAASAPEAPKEKKNEERR